MIVDTDILIWFLRGRSEAARFLDTCDPVLLSAVTYMELVQGMRNARELQILRRTLKLKEAELENLYFGGLLHDIGKIGTPAHLLDKNGRLTDEEFDNFPHVVLVSDTSLDPSILD